MGVEVQKMWTKFDGLNTYCNRFLVLAQLYVVFSGWLVTTHRVWTPTYTVPNATLYSVLYTFLYCTIIYI